MSEKNERQSNNNYIINNEEFDYSETKKLTQ